MKELKQVGEIIKKHFPIQRKYTRKNWAIAESRRGHKRQIMRNGFVENDYHKILTIVKQQFLKPGEQYFERDFKYELPTNHVAMHCFISSTFYFYLECCFTYDYYIHYSFNDCPFELQIREMLKPYPMNERAEEKSLTPDYKTFYARVVAFHGDGHTHTLKINKI